MSIVQLVVAAFQRFIISSSNDGVTGKELIKALIDPANDRFVHVMT
jgi:hypothetical protein